MESFKASEESQMNEEEWQARIDLAALYRLAAHFGYDDLIWNHITMRVPEPITSSCSINSGCFTTKLRHRT